MRVLHVLNELRFSGAERMLQAAGPFFTQHGVRSTILSLGAVPGPMAGMLAEAGHEIRHLPFGPAPAFLKSFRHVAGHHDVVHIHTERANFWLALAARSTGARILRTVHGQFQFTGALRVRRLLQRGLLRWAGVRHVAISRTVQAVEWERFANPTTLVRNWYDDRRLRPPTGAERAAARSELGLLDRQTAIVTVGNCSPVKDHATLMRALARYTGERDLVYLHAGQEEAGAPERRLCQELGIADRVRFLGPRDDVRAVLHAADLFVMPSLGEGFGIAAAEAFACGLPAILTDAPGLRDYRTDFRYAEVPVGDAEALARQLDLPIGPPLLDQAATAARLYGIAAGASAYLRLYGGDDRASASTAS